MRFFTKELIGMLTLLIALYLILVHNRGFARSVTALGGGLSGVAKTLQGRG